MAIKFGDHFFLAFDSYDKYMKNKLKPCMYPSRFTAEKFEPNADIIEYAPFHSGTWERIGQNYVECKHFGTLFSTTDDVNAGSNKWRFCPWCGSNNIEVKNK